MRKIVQILAITVGACGMVIGANAQTTSGSTSTETILGGQTAAMDELAASKGQTLVADKTASSFITLAGSKDNALALVTGLRNGTPITLTAAAPAGTTTSIGTTTGSTTTGGSTGTGVTVPKGTTITPPTGKMGWGNVFISLALAQKVLTQAGITNPTAAQLQTALMGGNLVGADGKTVAVKGVLQLRADGMGWGKIAQVYGTKLGPVVSELKSANKLIASTPAASGTSAGTSTTAQASSKATLSTGKGVTTAGGTTAGTAGAKGLATADGSVPTGKGAGIVTAGGAGNGHGNSFGKGVVTAAGGNAASAATSAAGARGAGAGAGLVTATGVAASNAATGLTTAQGNAGQGNANGNGKGKGG